MSYSKSHLPEGSTVSPASFPTSDFISTYGTILHGIYMLGIAAAVVTVIWLFADRIRSDWRSRTPKRRPSTRH